MCAGHAESCELVHHSGPGASLSRGTVWTAQKKHASYSSEWACDNGGPDVGKSPAPAGLEARLGQIAARAGGKVGVSVLHVESGQVAAIGGAARLPLYSVFKLPLAVAVLKAVEAGQLSLEQTVSIAREDVAPGAPGNTERWRDVPTRMTVRQLLELSLVASDNS